MSRVTFTGCVRFYFPRKERVRGSALACMCIGGTRAHIESRAYTDVGKESVGYTHDVVVGPTTGARDCASMEGDGTFLWWGGGMVFW